MGSSNSRDLVTRGPSSAQKEAPSTISLSRSSSFFGSLDVLPLDCGLESKQSISPSLLLPNAETPPSSWGCWKQAWAPHQHLISVSALSLPCPHFCLLSTAHPLEAFGFGGAGLGAEKVSKRRRMRLKQQ